MEHRGLLGALGVAVISFGASILIAYGTATYARGKEFDWVSGYVFVGEGIIFVGFALLVTTVILIERQKWKIRQLDAITGVGNVLMDKLEVSITNIASAVPVKELIESIINWEAVVEVWLSKYLPQYEKYFRNRGGHVALMWENVPPQHMQNDDTAAYAVNMTMLSGHLSRLAEITMKL